MAFASLLSRRNMLLTLAGGTASTVALTTDPSGEAAGGPLAKLFRSAREVVSGVPLAQASFEDWAAKVNSMFTSETGHVLELVNVAGFTARARPAGMRSRAFAARFDVVRGDVLAGDRTYRFNHPDAGIIDIFLTAEDPVNPKRMLAVFD